MWFLVERTLVCPHFSWEPSRSFPDKLLVWHLSFSLSLLKLFYWGTLIGSKVPVSAFSQSVFWICSASLLTPWNLFLCVPRVLGSLYHYCRLSWWLLFLSSQNERCPWFIQSLALFSSLCIVSVEMVLQSIIINHTPRVDNSKLSLALVFLLSSNATFSNA